MQHNKPPPHYGGKLAYVNYSCKTFCLSAIYEAAFSHHLIVNTGKNKRIFQIIEKKKQGEKISALTAYDYPQALLVDRAGVDILLVGDSLGNVVLGRKDTTEVKVEEMIHHIKAVKRAEPRSLIVADLPANSYSSVDMALTHSEAFTAAGADAVKLEGGQSVFPQLKALTSAGFQVLGHAGLLPQTAHLEGGFKIKGKTTEEAELILKDAMKIEEAGAFGVVLELVPPALAAEITSRLSIPTIGIGAGKECDGQILVLHDILGLGPGPFPRHVKPPVHYFELMAQTLSEWKQNLENSNQ